MGRKYVLGLDLGTLLGVAQVFIDGEIDATTGKGNAKKPGMQAAAKAVGVCLKEDEADAVWAAAFALDGSLFG